MLILTLRIICRNNGCQNASTRFVSQVTTSGGVCLLCVYHWSGSNPLLSLRELLIEVQETLPEVVTWATKHMERGQGSGLGRDVPSMPGVVGGGGPCS